MNAILHWLTQNMADVPEGDDWLSESECRILATMRFPKRRNDWRLGRWTVKQAIRAYLENGNLPLTSLEIRAAADGAPEAFSGGLPVNVSISISHSNNRSLCVAGPPDVSIGCDLERLEARENNLVADYFTSEEIYLCSQASETEKAVIVNLIWSAKESTLKILREGLRRDTRSIRIDPDLKGQGADWSLWTGYCLDTSRSFYGWWRSDGEYVYTLGSNHPTSFPKQICF
jgi:4'-phosphopantetheinyl transferase